MSAVALLRSQVQAALPRFDLPLTITPQPAPGLLPIGIPALDALTQGGIPRGSLTEFTGEASSGRTTILHSLLSGATSRGEYCALIDANDAFDPATAAECGAALSHLLWIRCGANAENALKAADRIVQSGGFGLVIFDLADMDLLSARRISLASWFRLRHAVEKTSSALAVFARQFNARSCSRLQIEMRRTGATWTTQMRSLAFEAESRKFQISHRAAFEAQRFRL
jgi:recombination protein RecA